ncbi:MAG: metallophosphoesterase family protein [Phycisphaeraceae bacterium]
MQLPAAVISDIHGNLEALTAVLEDVDRRGIKSILCLGDIIGYGPNPRECLDRVAERCDWALMGNHDYAVMYEPTNFNAGAESAAFWTRRQFEMEPDVEKRRRRWEFMGAMPVRKRFGDSMMAVHGSPRRPINEYVFADDVTTSPAKMQQLFDRIERLCFVGHTHVQGVFTEGPDFLSPTDFDHQFRIPDGEKLLVNVGSVGQPRDRDPRSGYTIIHDDMIEFVRLEYDIQTTVEKVRAIHDLNDFFGQRLIEGR